MKIQPVASPHAIHTPNTSNASEARERAIAKLVAQPAAPTQGQAQQTPVANPNQISPEELSAIQTPESADKNTEVVDEVVTPVEEPKKPEDTPESRRWAQMARQEKAIRAKAQQQDAAYKVREEALKAREAALTAKDQEYQTKYIPRDRLKSEAMTVLAEEGITYDYITEQALNQQAINPQIQAVINKLQSEIKDLKTASEKTTSTYAEQQKLQYETAVKQLESDAKSLVKSNPVEYEAINAAGAIKDVVKLIEDTYNQDGVLMSVEEAAQEVENYLIEESLKLTSLEKIKKRMSQTSATQGKSEVKTQATTTQTQQAKAPTKTLTNNIASTRKLSAKERAILAFKNELKN